VLVTLVAVFEIGSIVAALAPNSRTLIVGRAITGAGGGGISAGSLILINILVPLQSRPKYSGGVGSMFGLASIIGPLLGGYLTAVSWRWCFWINVPIGAVSLVVLAFATPKTPPAVKPSSTWRSRVAELDPLGFALIAPATVCLLFALQWGGTQYPWNSGRIIALFVLFGVLTLAFIAVQAWRKDDATVPPRIFFQRTIFSGLIAATGIGSLLVVFAFYLPIWFQAIQGKSPQSSGLSLLPLLLSNVLVVGIAGVGTSVWGYYTPFMYLGGALCIVGAALISTWQVDTGPGQWIGYQVCRPNSRSTLMSSC
jgi:MFS family permease